MLMVASDSTVLDVLSRLGPVATAVAAIVALAVGVATIRQRTRADQRDQWWKRAQWALDLSLDDDPVKVARGYAVLAYLADSELADTDEQALLAAAAAAALEVQTPASDNEVTTTGDDQEGGDDERTAPGA